MKICAECLKVKSKEKEYYSFNPYWCKECVKLYARAWSKKNRDKVSKSTMRWQRENVEKTRATRRKSVAKVRSTSKGRLCHSISTGINQALHGLKKGKHWATIVGYTPSDLVKHLESRFDPGMTWDNYGQWHIDHIIPISAYNFSSPQDIDFQRCWSLNNLQPMWGVDNMRKHGKLEKPFQPSLTMGEWK